jgi:hypothetical protein
LLRFLKKNNLEGKSGTQRAAEKGSAEGAERAAAFGREGDADDAGLRAG